MPERSAGLLMYRRRGEHLEVLLVHPGGPFFARKDAGAWTIPKGLLDGDEEPLDAAVREFREETSFAVEGVDFIELGDVRLASGKLVQAWAVAGDCDPAQLRSNTFELEWPPRSGRRQSYPEVDRAAWFDVESARTALNPAQAPFLDRLLAALEPRAE
jgi:predicted NUDIX family NTP pyrophosphohydrolase